MKLWLNGKFWGPWIRRVFIPEIEWTRRAILDHMLTSLPDANLEGERIQKESFEAVTTGCSDDQVDPLPYIYWAMEQGLNMYERILRLRQAVQNMASVMLWHLVEQQMLTFYFRQVLTENEESLERQDEKQRKTKDKLRRLHDLLDKGGYSFKSLSSWSKVNELQLVANVVKHGLGRSCDDLYKIRPDMFNMPGIGSSFSSFPPSYVENPAGGRDLYVTNADLSAYFDATLQLWQDFSLKIEEPSK